MIHPNELRIGNLVSHNSKSFVVTSLSKNAVEVASYDNASASLQAGDGFGYITLTENWMKALADNETGNINISSLERTSESSDMILLSTVECYLHEDGFLRVCAYEYDKDPNGSTAAISDDVIILGYKHITFVHQLQNLYFDLTGSELSLQTTLPVD